ncbi:uncharacterized protein LOC126835735 [Adelges cooleyi]|uniref:uncharacterized protein LOC126835735 n=1 Tax=Adelges cooleyi TaxID=133065 RepID=UPI00217FF246|nr:uncharacterized protein LOC126835735 [Adelges cooleyi]
MMKLHCLLISTAIVQVLASLSFRDYKRAVFNANRHLERAITNNIGLMQVVTNIVLGDSTIEEIVLLLAVPELATPRFLDGDKCDQTFLQAKIAHFTFQPVPIIDNEANFGDMVLAYLGVNKRSLIGEPRKLFLRASNLLPYLGTARRCTMKLVTIQLFTAIFRGEAPDYDNFGKICSLICLYRSIRHPVRIIRHANVDDNGVCNIRDRTRVIKQYKFVNNDYYEVRTNADQDITLKALLRDQVTEWAAEGIVP